MNKHLLNYIVLFAFLFFTTTLNTLASSTFILNTNSTFESYADWSNNGNWILKNGDSSQGYPTDDDIITTSDSYGGYDNLNINFDLRNYHPNLTLSPIKYTFTLNLKSEGVCTFNFNISGKQVTISTESGSNLIINNDLVFGQSGNIITAGGKVIVIGKVTMNNSNQKITINEGGELIVRKDLQLYNSQALVEVSGNLTVNGNTAANNSGSKIYIKESGIMDIDQTVTSSNGGKIYFEVCGILRIHGNLDITGTFDLHTCDEGVVEIDGDFIFNCNGDSNITGDGNINVGGECHDCSSGSNSTICDDVDLPVSLLFFKGEQTPEGHLLLWSTASETNSSHFDVEVSSDRRNWTVVGSVEAAGNSNVQLDYEFLDDYKEGQYYRLAQYDLDNAVEYFGVVTFSENDNATFTVFVYPTETRNGEQLVIEMTGVNANEPVVGIFYDLNGKILSQAVLSKDVEGNVVTTVNVPTTTKGINLLKVSNGYNTKTAKIIIN
ncbi:hypothetical protein [Flammeovirga kamogawensis]|uniref:T9SS type A sorting domain-containing protein n=1 Tax=Flammeovirga kamogawensis TaxID=373891 RepID=A0ABX8H140_9BACT|nr:hypothetical protein [Flammeovirga kamogawensis]MBB6462191.1 hypothetical protein [Flammeovirga kamogawensis]QWG09408.1 hypothetical protein KM029_22640 [Flammeovirga kamogawensis]TRX64926.1 hypothetical protein EO216_20550 [Flammeovirga kamogawensis]